MQGCHLRQPWEELEEPAFGCPLTTWAESCAVWDAEVEESCQRRRRSRQLVGIISETGLSLGRKDLTAPEEQLEDRGGQRWGARPKRRPGG